VVKKGRVSERKKLKFSFLLLIDFQDHESIQALAEAIRQGVVLLRFSVRQCSLGKGPPGKPGEPLALSAFVALAQHAQARHLKWWSCTPSLVSPF